MSKTCSRCDKAVYPTEELKCLDKLWHKTCFKCQTCGMALNMKTYKGYNKLPYCEAHIPKAKATTVTETPEMRRLAENTKLQSQVQYHADFEKAKGKFTQVADDPETLRIKANTKIISNVSYHGELEKKAAMEQKRTLTGDEANGHDNSGSAEDVPDPVAEVISQHQQRSVPTAQTSPSHHYQHQQQQQHPQQHHYQYQQQPQQQLHHQQQGNHHLHQSANHRQPDFKTGASSIRAPNTESSQNSRPMASSTVVYCSQPNALDVDELVEYDWKQGTNQPMPVSHDGHFSNQSQGRRIGSINDYDPVNENHGSQSQTYRVTPQQQQQPQYMQQQQTQQQKLQQYYQQQQRQHALHVQQQQAMQQQAMQQQQAIQQQQALQQQAAMQHQQAMQQQALQHQHSASQQNYAGSVGISSGYHQAANAQSRNSGRSYRAMYDYDADDDDEVSFRDGDVIVDCKSIDEGWMMGTVLRTGRSGMVPANYIEPIN